MPEPVSPLSVREALAGKHVFLTGGSGFVGKVWLAMALCELPEIERIYVFLRPKALVPARQRFEKMLNTSPAFQPLHERHGARLGAYLDARVEVVEGDLEAEDLGLDPETAARLRRDLDVFVHCAGLVDFNPDLRKAIGSNVEATLRVADFVASCAHASLLHISTCYVAGRRYGEIPESLPDSEAPSGEPLNAEHELAAANAEIEEIVRAHDTAAEQARARRAVLEKLREERRDEPSPKLIETLVRKQVRERLKQALSDAGMARAERWGFPNTYTYTKSLAERLLAARAAELRFSILRPSIVESALDFPFAGWNESFNGSAPLAYVMGTWFRMVPAKPDAPFDVIPVDQVCRAMTLATAALVENRHRPVYHVGSSDRHRCSVGRAAELIVLAHRRYLREHHRSARERVFKSRWDAVLVEPDHPFGVRASRTLLARVESAIDLLPDKLLARAQPLLRRTREIDERLAQIENMVELYLPFMYDSHYVFVSRALDAHPPLEPEFAFRPEDIDWRKYWIEVHIPGLRRWAFPLIEGKRPERYRSQHPVRLSTPPAAPAERVELLPSAMALSANVSEV